nr:hypothetical protein [uncultured Acetatifactor sp.]
MKIFGCILVVLYVALMLFALYMEKKHSRKGAHPTEETHPMEEEHMEGGHPTRRMLPAEEAHSAEKTKSASSAFITAGCLLNLGYTVCNVFWNRNFILILIFGMICISIGALMNGFRQKKVHVHHHIIRLILETIITVFCWIGG